MKGGLGQDGKLKGVWVRMESYTLNLTRLKARRARGKDEAGSLASSFQDKSQSCYNIQ